MAAVHRGVRGRASNWSDWDRSRNLVVILMLLLIKIQETCMREPIHPSETGALVITVVVSHEGACPCNIYQRHVPGTFSYGCKS